MRSGTRVYGCGPPNPLCGELCGLWGSCVHNIDRIDRVLIAIKVKGLESVLVCAGFTGFYYMSPAKLSPTRQHA